MEGFQSENSKINHNESSPRKKFPNWLRKATAIGALAIASYVSYGTYSKFYGLDYSDAGSFNEAFKRAKKDNKKLFRWHGRRFTTNLVDKEFSDNYLESKKFLEAYFSSDYFKAKQKNYGFFEIESELWDKNLNRLKWLSSQPILTEEEKKELNMCNNLLLPGAIKASEEFANRVREYQAGKANERVEALHDKSYFSITTQKGQREDDGSYKEKTGEVFVSGKPDPKDKDRETTPVHELSHKATKSNTKLASEDYLGMQRKVEEATKDTRKYYTDDDFKYLSNPTEIDARQNSTRFWLFKHFPGYTANTAFTQEHYDFLQNRSKDLPYDIRQLMELFSRSSDFISNMNTY